MGNDAGVIAPAALGDVEIGNFRNDLPPDIVAIGDDEVGGVLGLNGICRSDDKLAEGERTPWPE